jgi:hypothetical protein
METAIKTPTPIEAMLRVPASEPERPNLNSIPRGQWEEIMRQHDQQLSLWQNRNNPEALRVLLEKPQQPDLRFVPGAQKEIVWRKYEADLEAWKRGQTYAAHVGEPKAPSALEVKTAKLKRQIQELQAEARLEEQRNIQLTAQFESLPKLAQEAQLRLNRLAAEKASLNLENLVREAQTAYRHVLATHGLHREEMWSKFNRAAAVLSAREHLIPAIEAEETMTHQGIKDLQTQNELIAKELKIPQHKF